MATYGIDLGTTYSCLSKLDNNGNPVIIRNFDDNTDWIASAVYFEEGSENIIIGDAAKQYALIHPGRVVEYAKRYIGRTGDQTRSWEIDGKVYKPEQISAMILKRIVEYARGQNEEVQDVVITCPAYFDFAQREATSLAGQYAGLNVVEIVNEPTAAALSYCHREFEENQTLMVYDLGGGTFDISIIKMSLNWQGGKKLEVLSTVGDDLLGGKDWDEVLFKLIFDKYCDENAINEDARADVDLETRNAIKGQVEVVKKRLSTADSARATIQDAGMRTSVTITREEFEAQTRHLVDRTMGFVHHAYKLAGSPVLSKVLLVGGSTLMPMIRNRLEESFPNLVQMEDPHLAVAKGAAILGSMTEVANKWDELQKLIQDRIIILQKEKESTPEGGEASQPSPPTQEEMETIVKEVNKELEKQGKETISLDESPDMTAIVTGVLSGQPPERAPAIELVETAHRSLGPAVLIGEELMIDNLVIRGAQLPIDVQKTYYIHRDNQPRITLRLYQSLSTKEHEIPDRWLDDSIRETDPALDVKAFDNPLTLPLPAGCKKDDPVDFIFRMTKSGVYMKVSNPADGSNQDVEYSFYDEVSEEEMDKTKAELDRKTYLPDSM